MSTKQDLALAVGIVGLLLAVHRVLTSTNAFEMQQLTMVFATLILFLLLYLAVKETAPANKPPRGKLGHPGNFS